MITFRIEITKIRKNNGNFALKIIKMANPYITTYPDVMKGKKIMYVHGFMSSAQSGTVTLLQTLLPSATVVAEDIPIHPAEAMDMLTRMAEREQPDLIIGTSMGGMYTEMLRGYDRIVVNPAFEMGQTMAKSNMIGRMTFQNPRKDGVEEVVVTKALVKEYAEMTQHCFAGITPEEQRRVYGLFGDNDPQVHTFDIFHEHYPQAIYFHGEHQLVEKVVYRYLIPIVRWIDDRQEGRERPVVLMGIDTLRDSHGKQTSSMHKAFERLIEQYDVHIVATAPTNDPAALSADGAWVADNLSAPAWNRVIYTNTPQLLCADYLITAQPAEGFMGTVIDFGSDKFKTWEEIIAYFDLLGGQ